MRTKLVTIEEAASIVHDGDQVVMSSGFGFSPMTSR